MFRGENNREAPTEKIFAQGFLTKFRNYHLTGRGAARKRKGHQPFLAEKINGNSPVQSLAMYEFGTTRRLVGVSNGVLKYTTGSSWTDITGGLTLASGADNRLRWTQFIEGPSEWLIGNDGVNPPFKWDGSASPATPIGGGGEGAPAYAGDMVEFFGRLWAINTDSGATITEYGEDGDHNLWPGGNAFHASRDSIGMALTKHNDGVLLIFHQRSIHRVEPNYDYGEFFARRLVDDSVGCTARHSVVTYKGVTYFIGQDGPYRIRDPRRPAEYIGWPIENYFNSLNKERQPQIVGFYRQEPWNEIVWLVSTGDNEEHNAAIVWNPVMEGWSIFESPGDDMSFNCGADYVVDGKHITVCGTYDGNANEAWGDDAYDTGNLDGGESGAPVRTEFETGFLDYGYPGLKRTREYWYDMDVQSVKTFTLNMSGVADTPAVSSTFQGGSAGSALGSFILGTSTLAGDNPKQLRKKISVKGRLLRKNITESDEGIPHTINFIRGFFVPRGLRIKSRS